MSSHANTDRLYHLASRLFDGDITAQELNELDALLKGNEAAAREYLDCTRLHFQLEQRLRTDHPDASESAEQPRHSDRASAVEGAAPSGASGRSPRVKPFAVLAIAASLLVAVTFWAWREWSGRNFTARIEQLVDCDWDEVRWGPLQLATLEVGREIRFDHGLMMLEFGDGAEVTLEGPVRFKIAASDRVVLKLGKLTATVPRRGQGFAVQMPSAEIIDLGTKFGALVGADGSCEAHVFEGRVLVRSDFGQQTSDEFELAAGSAWQLPASATSGQRIAARPESFVHATRFVDPAAASDDTQVALPDGSRPILWLNAARRLQLDQAGNVVSWGNLRSTGDHNAEGNAWQLAAKERPAWMPKAIENRPAVRFDGSTYLVTTPLATSNDVTVVCVFKSQQQASGVSTGQILDLNGPANLILEATEKNRLIGRVSSTLASSGPASTEVLEAPLVEEGGLWLAVYRYHHSSNRSELFLNGQLVAAGAASAGIAGRTSKFIGKSSAADNHFVGDVAEVLVFDSALSADKCVQISSELMSKYGIAKLEAEPRVLYRPPPSQP